MALILVVHITDESYLEIMYLYSKHDRNLRARSKVCSRIISPNVTITFERYLYRACPLISQQLFSNGTSIILVDGIVLCSMKCETETEDQKPWAGKKSVLWCQYLLSHRGA